MLLQSAVAVAVVAAAAARSLALRLPAACAACMQAAVQCAVTVACGLALFCMQLSAAVCSLFSTRCGVGTRRRPLIPVVPFGTSVPLRAVLPQLCAICDTCGGLGAADAMANVTSAATR